MMVEELLGRIVGDDNVSRHYFKFMCYIQKLPRLRIYVTVADGEALITDVNAFVENLKRYVDHRDIKAPKIVEGVKELEI